MPWPGKILCALVGAISLASCGSNGSTGKVQIRYMAWGTPEQIKIEQSLCDKFNSENPGLEVKFFRVPANAYEFKAALMLASHTAPDVMRIDHYNFPQLQSKDYFLDLDPLIEADRSFHASDYFPWTLAEGTVGGKLYGLNTMSGGMVMYYNKTMFQSAGLADPNNLATRGQWTYGRFRLDAIAMTKFDSRGRPIRYGCDIPTFPFTALGIWAFGGDILSKDGKRCLLDQPAAIRAYRFYVDLRWKDRCAPTPSDSANGAFTFESGKVGMVFGWMGNSPIYNARVKGFDWDICPLPSGPFGNPSVVKGNQLVISKESPHPREAWQFIRFLTSPEVENILYVKNRRAFPTLKSVVASSAFMHPSSRPYNVRAFIEGVENSRPLPIDDRWQEWTRELSMREESL
ncbi:MAG TPA: sugar ABC transporter substrate-binding protein, partial [Fimbriimonadaceae bacterium]|nr:sugar ABC transporter substrate-binding protein [Fimbriimonadaceae bacterium]